MKKLLHHLGIQDYNRGTWIGTQGLVSKAQPIQVYSPVDGKGIAKVEATDREGYERVITSAEEAFKIWRGIPSPHRGEIVRQLGKSLRQHKNDLGQLVSYEMGKSLQEGMGEVQEMIDICDFAVGLSRQLCGQTMHSERPSHRMYEQWHPLGVVGIISAFNFPVAVWSWNTAIAWVCGNVCVWKPSEKTPLTALACQRIIGDVLIQNNMPAAVSTLINGSKKQGEWLSQDKKVALLSATGSSRMGQNVGNIVSQRFGKSLLELGGNNAVIITAHANLKIAVPAVVFGAIGTAGQRCTTTRRVIIHRSIYNTVKEKLVEAYQQLNIGNPLDETNHVGPLIDTLAVDAYLKAITTCKVQGGHFAVEGGLITVNGYEGGSYVQPCIAEVKPDFEILQTEIFAPILYIMPYDSLDQAIAIQNDVPQGLSSSIITENIKEAEIFLSARGSDCGIANVNIGTSGAEIGGAFGGEKETGGGRESGSDAWKSYMRRQTVTINYSDELPLAQGITFW